MNNDHSFLFSHFLIPATRTPHHQKSSRITLRRDFSDFRVRPQTFKKVISFSNFPRRQRLSMFQEVRKCYRCERVFKLEVERQVEDDFAVVCYFICWSCFEALAFQRGYVRQR